MAYKTVSPDAYLFPRESANLFSQELIENVLFDFGHIWKPEHSRRDSKLLRVASFVFIPPIGRLVAYVSRKYAGFVVMKCLRDWNYINSHRPCVREQMICNEIVILCTRSELKIDDLGLFTFLALVVDYARLVLTHDQEHLIGPIANSLGYCLTSEIPGGFVSTLERLKRRASSFIYPRNYIIYDYDPRIRFLNRVSTDTVYTPRSEFEPPRMFEKQASIHFYHTTPIEDIIKELKNRKLHREIFRRKMMIDCATQTEIDSKPNVFHLHCTIINSNITDFSDKIIIQSNLNNPVPVGTLMLVETTDISVQTWTVCGVCCLSCGRRRPLYLDTVIEKLKFRSLEQVQVYEESPSCSGAVSEDITERDNRKDEKETGDLNILPPLQYCGSRELDLSAENKSIVSNTCKYEIIPLQSVEENYPSTSTSGNVNRDDSQFGILDLSADERTDERTKNLDKHYSEKKNISF